MTSSRLHQLFASPNLEPEDQQRIQVLLTACVLILEIVIGLFLLTLVVVGPLDGLTLPLNVLTGGFVVGLHVLLHRGRRQWVAWALPSLLFAANTLVIYINGNVRSPSLMGYAFILILVALSVGESGLLVFGGLTLVAVSGLFLAEFTLFQPPTPIPLSILDLVILLLSLTAITALLSFAIRQIASALQRASARALERDHLNATLEQRVAARTLELHTLTQQLQQELTEHQRAEKALRRSEAFLNATNQIARIGGWELDLQTNELYWSDTVKEIHEVTLDYVPNLAEGINFYAPEAIPVIRAAIEGAIAGRPYDVELQIITARHNRLWVRAIGRPVYEHGRVVKLQGTFQDVHPRRLADDALRRSEALLNVTNQIARTGGWELDLRTNALYWTDSVKAIHEVSPDYVPNIAEAINFYAPEDAPVIQAAVEGALGGKPYELELQIVTARQTRLWVYTNGRPVYADGQIVKLLGVFQDIHERKQTEQTLQEQRELFSQIFHSSPTAIVLTRQADGRLVEVNESFLKLTGYPLEKLVGLTLAEAGMVSASQAYAEQLAMLEQGRPAASFELQIAHQSGERRTSLVSLGRASIKGEPFVLTTFSDITDHQHLEAELQTTKDRLQHLLASSPTVIYSAQAYGDFSSTYISDNVRSQLGYEPQMFIGQPEFWADRQHPENVTESYHEAHEVIRLGQFTSEYRFRHQDGTYRWLRDEAKLIRDAAGQPLEIVGSWTDITARKQTEEALQESEHRFRQMAETIREVFWITRVNQAGTLYVSPGYEDIWGRSVVDLYSDPQNWLEGIHPEDRERVRRAFTQAPFGGYDEEFRVVRPDGTQRWVHDRGFPVFNQAGEVYRIAGLAADITERKQAEAAQHQAEAELRRIMTSISDYLWSAEISEAGQVAYRYYSPVVEKVSGYPSEYFLENTERWLQLIDPRDQPRLFQAFTRLVNRVSVREEEEYRILRPDGIRRWVRDSVIATPLPNGRVQLNGVVSDITDRKQAEEALRQSEANLREAQRLAQLGNFEFDLQTQAVRWSEVVYDIFEINPTTPITLEMYQQALPPADFQRVMEHVGQSIATGEAYEVEHDLLLPDGRRKNLFALGRPVVNPAGQVTHIFGVVQDITARKQAEVARQASEMKYRLIVETAQEGIWMIDEHNRTGFVNHKLAEMLGYTVDEMLGRSLFDFMDEEGVALAQTNVDRRRQGVGEQHDFKFRRKDGGAIWALLSTSPILTEGQTYVGALAMVSDITARKQAEAALRESEALYRALFEQSHDGVILHQAETGRVIKANRAIAQMLEYDITDLIGTTYTDDVPPDELADAQERWRRTLSEGHLPPYERRLITRTGQSRHFEITTNAISDSASGAPRFMQAVLRDITERKQTEQRLQAALLEKEILLREIHHRVKNNLQVISSLLYLQSQKIKDASLLELFRESQNRVAAMALVHEQLYQGNNFARVDFDAYVRRLVASLFESYGVDTTQIALRVTIDHASLTINTAVPCGLLVSEIVSNALKHGFPTGRRGEIVITLRSEPGLYHLCVSDDGVGLPEASQLRPGSLGLRLIERLTAQLGGQVERTGPPGTAYVIRFPGNEHERL